MSSGADVMPTNDRGPNARLALGPGQLTAHHEAGYRLAVRSLAVITRSARWRMIMK